MPVDGVMPVVSGNRAGQVPPWANPGYLPTTAVTAGSVTTVIPAQGATERLAIHGWAISVIPGATAGLVQLQDSLGYAVSLDVPFVASGAPFVVSFNSDRSILCSANSSLVIRATEACSVSVQAPWSLLTQA